MIGYHALQVLDLLVFSDPQKDFVFHPPKVEDEDHKIIRAQKNLKSIKYSDCKTFTARLDWAINLVFSPRLLHYSNTLESNQVPPSARSAKGFLRYYAPRAAILYVLIDFMCYYMRLIDPLFFLPSFPSEKEHTYEALLHPDPPPPAWYPSKPAPENQIATFIWSSALYTIRQLLQAGAIAIILTLFHQLLALTMVSFHSIFPSSTWTSPSSYPPLFSNISLRDGLPAFWGKTWHATFKRIFTSPSDYLGLAPKSRIRFFLAFVLSGALHSLGAYSQCRRWSGPLIFFVLQGVGASAEVMVRNWLKGRGITNANSAVLRWVVRIWVCVWLLWTGEWFTDEYRRGGLWTAEPVPWSIWRWGARRWGFWGWGVRW